MYEEHNENPKYVLTRNPTYYDEWTGDVNDEEAQFKEAMQIELKLKVSKSITKMLSGFSSQRTQGTARDKEAEEGEEASAALRNQD